MAMHKKSFSVDVDDELSKSFSKQVEDRGYTKYRALEAAIRAFLAIPSEAQVSLIENKISAKDILLNAFRDMGLEADLQKLPPAQRAQILTIAKEAAKKVSRKK